MKNTIHIISILFCFSMQGAFSQNNIKNDVVILVNGDTISIPEIINNGRRTNQDKITYIDIQKKKHELAVSEVKVYFVENGTFFSDKIKNIEQNRFIKYEVIGYISFGISYRSNGELIFYVKKDNEVTSLEEHKFKLMSFFSGYLIDFVKFYSQYKVKISYDLKTLAEMISAYNAFKFPDKYVFVKYKNKEPMRVGVFGSAGLMNAKISDFITGNLYGVSSSFGLDITTIYSRYFSFHLPVSYNKQSSKSSISSIHLSTLNLEPYLSFIPIPKKKFFYEIGAGYGMMYSFNNGYVDCSSIKESDQDHVKFNKISLGINGSIIANITRNIKVQLIYAHYNIRSFDIKIASPDDTSVKASINNFRFMVSYYF